MNRADAVLFALYVLLGAAGLLTSAFAQRFAAMGERALQLSIAVAVGCLAAWHRGIGDPISILGLSLFCFGAPLALAYGFHARRNAPDRRLAWGGLALGLVVFGLFICWMIASVLNFGEATGLWELG
jgi:hypothetical protein